MANGFSDCRGFRVYNSGSAPPTVSSFKITNQNGVALGLTVNECGAFPAILAVGKSCGIAAAANNQAYDCVAVVGPGKADMRGNFDVRNSSGLVLQNTPMR